MIQNGSDGKQNAEFLSGLPPLLLSFFPPLLSIIVHSISGIELSRDEKCIRLTCSVTFIFIYLNTIDTTYYAYLSSSGFNL